MKHHIERQYGEVRRVFFPRWDRTTNWSLQIVEDLDGAHGRCDAEAKQIRLTADRKGNELTILLIHEIAHAVAGAFHGQRWQSRMEKAAQVAEKLGQADLAAMLRHEVAGYRSSGLKIEAKTIYTEIEDAVSDLPEADFLQVVDWVRREYGWNRGQFFKRFRRARAVFEEARRYRQEQMKLKAAMLATGNGGIS